VIQVKGAIPGKMDAPIALDSKVADSVSMSSTDGRNSQITIELPLMIEDSGYRIFTLPGDGSANKPFRVVVDINAPASPVVFNFTAGLKNKTIVLDPGHGGSDSGAIGPGKIQEKTVNLAVALKVKALLEKAGAIVLMTRQDDVDVFAPNDSAVDELKARATVGNSNKADIFVSIHANAFPKPTVGGSGTYFYQKTPYDALLAQNIQAGLIQYDGLKDRGVIPARFYVLKKTVMPAALVELAFLSNPAEEKLLIDPQFQQKMAQGIVQGLDQFFQQAAKMGGDR
jgi:N-acetylmuramoyl-L-alanine amidase